MLTILEAGRHVLEAFELFLGSATALTLGAAVFTAHHHVTRQAPADTVQAEEARV